MEMKKIYKSLMALAAALVLVPAAYAQSELPVQYQHEKYLFNEEKGIGYNKYLVSNTPNADGEYTLRVENFITGEVKQTAIPTDFILVLDISGSMLYDYRPSGTTVPQYIRKADNDARDDNHALKLRLDDGQERGINHYRYTGVVTDGAVGTKGSGGYDGYATALTAKDPSNNANYANRWYYYPEDETYYRLFRYAEKIDGATRYYIYFDRVDANGAKIERRYVIQDGDNITTTTTKPTNITGEKIIIFIDNMNNSGYKLYRVKSRKDALKEGVNTFIDLIKAENNKDQWSSGVTKHQVAIVAFGSTKITDLNERAATANRDNNSFVARIFREIDDSNAESYKNWDDRSGWIGGTLQYWGTTAAKQMLLNLQKQPNMQPLNGSGGTNRAKVMVVFTDGEPNNASGVSGYSNVRGSINLTNADGAVIKQTGWSGTPHTDENMNINGLVYTINLSTNTSYVPNFLKNLSSNNPIGTVNNGKSGGGDGTTYDGTYEDKGFYMDGNAVDLKSAFAAIAANNTGAMSTTLVSVDKTSDSFLLPFATSDKSKVKMYTAQCIGKKEIDGKEYLAFAQEIQVANRRALDHLWVIREDEVDGKKVPTWHDLPAEAGFRMDIDDDIDFKVTADGRSIILYGFNYADLWCGHDGAHENTRQIETTDPNYAYQLDGYRGFKVIFEFPIKVDPEAQGGVGVPTNDPSSGLYKADSNNDPTTPEVYYPEPDLPIPVKLIVKKAGLKAGESANFTVQRKLRGDDTAVYEDVLTFVLTGGVAVPEIRIPNLDPAYYYKIKEEDWSWAYENISKEYYTTDPNDNPAPKNPILFENNPIPDTPKHAEAKADNKMRKKDNGQNVSTAEFSN